MIKGQQRDLLVRTYAMQANDMSHLQLRAQPENSPSPTVQTFDMTVDDATDNAMEEIELVQEQTKQQAERKKQLIYDKVARHNREEVRDLPYLRASSTSSSSNQLPTYLMNHQNLQKIHQTQEEDHLRNINQ